ncbi:MAG: hypothetical protein GDA42_11490 [Ekhidna sp.]|nr:hypothetical protein [Ekhidna sp.]
MKVSLISFINKDSSSSSKHLCAHQRKLRESGEIVAWVFGKRNEKTVNALGCKIKTPGIKWGSLLTDNWKRLKRVFISTNHLIGKRRL